MRQKRAAGIDGGEKTIRGSVMDCAAPRVIESPFDPRNRATLREALQVWQDSPHPGRRQWSLSRRQAAASARFYGQAFLLPNFARHMVTRLLGISSR